MSSLSDNVTSISSLALKDHEMGQHLLVPDDENCGDLPSGPTSESDNDLVEEFVEEDHHVEPAVEDVDNNGETALMRAAKAGDLKKIDELVRRNVNVNYAHRHSKKTALFLAVEKRNVCVVEALISAGASVNEFGAGYRTPLHIAALQGSVEIAKLIVEASKETLAATTHVQMTPLMFAALADHYDLVKYFLQCSGGMDVNAVDWQGNSALHYAAAGRCLQAIDTRHKEVTLKALVEKGANVNEANHDGMTPIMNAISDGNEDAVAVLLASHADVNATTKFGMTPLMHAAAQGSTTVLTLLLNAGACAAVKTHDGNTALHYAASRGRFAAYELLRDKFGCSTSDQNSSGKTPEELFEHAKETKQGDRVSIFSR